MKTSALNTSELELVRVAIELARLHSGHKPGQFLDEAARLLTEARDALWREKQRPEREVEERREEYIQGIVRDSQANKIPFSKLCRPATKDEKTGGATDLDKYELFSFLDGDKQVEFSWKVYRGEREFYECLERHAARIYNAKTICSEVNELLLIMKKVKAAIKQRRKLAAQTPDQPQPELRFPELTEVRRMVLYHVGNRWIDGQFPSWGELVLASLHGRCLLDDWHKKFLAVQTSTDGKAVVESYVKAAIPVAVEHFWKLAKANGLDVISLYSIKKTREAGYKTRGPRRRATE